MKTVVNSILMFILMTLVLGFGYPFLVWAASAVAFPFQSNGSLIRTSGGELIGSELIGQRFDGKGWFSSRPSAAGDGYDAAASSGTNLGPTSAKLIDRVHSDSASLSAANGGGGRVPADLVTTSASGLDPHISPAAAEFQVARVAAERGLDESLVRRLVAANTDGRTFGFIGEPRVNVLKLNLALEAMSGNDGNVR